MWDNAQSVEVVERLLVAGPDVNAQDAQGRTALITLRHQAQSA